MNNAFHKNILRLHAENKDLKERIAELEANQAKHNLEQQALGIDNFSCEMLGRFKSDTIRKKIIKHFI